MKKLATITLAFVLVVLLVAAAGCSSGDTTTAKTDMKTADAAYAAVNKELTALGNMLTPILAGAVSGNFAALTPATLSAATAQITRIMAELPKVKADYVKITTLSGVPDYVSYANAMIKVVGLQETALTGAQKVINDLTPLVQTGNTAAITQYFVTNAATLNDLQSAQTAITTAESAAQSIKTSKNL